MRFDALVASASTGIKEVQTPLSLRIVDKSSWIGKALVFSRALLPQIKARPELA